MTEENAAVRQRFLILEDCLDERLRRLVAAAEAKVLGYGGVSVVAKATGVSRRAITVGLAEIERGTRPERSHGTARIRKEGGGRKRASDLDKNLRADLEGLVEPLARGDPESPFRWTCKSLRHLAQELKAQGHEISHTAIGDLLH